MIKMTRKLADKGVCSEFLPQSKQRQRPLFEDCFLRKLWETYPSGLILVEVGSQSTKQCLARCQWRKSAPHKSVASAQKVASNQFVTSTV
eukprot:1363917-Amphidinium_carterae.1